MFHGCFKKCFVYKTLHPVILSHLYNEGVEDAISSGMERSLLMLSEKLLEIDKVDILVLTSGNYMAIQ